MHSSFFLSSIPCLLVIFSSSLVSWLMASFCSFSMFFQRSMLFMWSLISTSVLSARESRSGRIKWKQCVLFYVKHKVHTALHGNRTDAATVCVPGFISYSSKLFKSGLINQNTLVTAAPFINDLFMWMTFLLCCYTTDKRIRLFSES